MVVVSCKKKNKTLCTSWFCLYPQLHLISPLPNPRRLGSNPSNGTRKQQRFCQDTFQLAVCDQHSRRGCPSSACRTSWTCRQTWPGLWASTPAAEPVRGGLWTFPGGQRQNNTALLTINEMQLPLRRCEWQSAVLLLVSYLQIQDCSCENVQGFPQVLWEV